MGRHRAFDEDEVLDLALEVFWQRGYGATSIDDLTAATGLKRGSLYAAFGDKDKLFIACLRRYTQRVQAPMIEALHHPDPRQAISLMFEKRHAQSSNPDVPPGCLLTNTVLERASISEAITRLNTVALAEFQSALYEVLCRAQVLGQLRPGHDPLALARFFSTLALGLTVVSKQSVEAAVHRDSVQIALSVLEPAAAKDRSKRSARPKRKVPRR